MKNKTRKYNHNSGITLMALVITIVILLVLAGISIMSLTGENGVLTKSQNAAEETIKQTATEKINLKITTSQINSYSKKQRIPTLQELADDFCSDNEIEYVVLESKVLNLNKINVQGHDSFFTKLIDYPYEFEINSSLQLASIDGIKIAKLPENDEDLIVSMTKSELQELINTSINNSLKNYSSTTEINQQYATKDELKEKMAPTLDWNNKINITTSLNENGKTYTAPKNGIILIFLDQNDTSNCCLNLSMLGGAWTKKYYANNTTSWATFSDEFAINKSDTVTVLPDSSLSGFRNFRLTFVPYK